jgi:hypothetical protein
MKKIVLHTALAGLCFAGAANAAEILVTTDIAVSTTWTASNTYNLQTQIYVLPGATLTIEPGTIIASDTNIGGSLAVTRGAQIIANGTAADPIIWTSKADVATWVGGDPKTGTWRPKSNEWGNLTICGDAYISENIIVANTPAPNASNYALMEGLVEAFPGDTRVRYGGGNDNDDSGSLRYNSFRYGGKVVSLNNELNGLSLGGVGRATDLEYIEIMNNVDDGIEIWGGTVNFKYFSIWNIGDDSVDLDQGYRGKAQFGLIVQGYSSDSPAASQGSAIGDNVFEMDGAEQSDYQPVTTAAFYNVTVIGQPISGDHGAAYRDGARVQINNSIFMDLGDRLISFDNQDGDGGAGYGFGGTLNWASTWTTPYNGVPAHPNDPIGLPGFYSAQSSGFLNQMTDTVFYNNLAAAAYTVATSVGAYPPNLVNNNVDSGTFSTNPANLPVRSITRGPAIPVGGGLTMVPVIGLDPRPAAAALTSVGSAPADGFFTPASYRGGFAPGGVQHWLCDWTASFAYGYTPAADLGTLYCFGDGTGTACPCANNSAVGDRVGCLSSLGTGGKLRATGCSSLSNDTAVLSGTQMPNSSALYFQGTTQQAGGAGAPFGDGLRCAAGSVIRLGTKINALGASQYPVAGDLAISVRGAITVPGTRTYQCWYRNAAAFCTASTFNLSNGLQIVWEL